MFSLHNHSEFSNASRGFADSSLSVNDLARRAKEVGLNGIACTDHEAVGGYLKFQRACNKYGVKPIFGNEIYLVSDKQDNDLRNNYQKGMFYPHFILLALDREGVHQIWQLSELAWRKSYWNSGLIRTTTRMDEIEAIIGEDKGHVVASTACLGGFLAKTVMEKHYSEDESVKSLCDRKVNAFLKWCLRVFGKENFYLEMQPNEQGSDQDIYNHYIKELSEKYGIPYIITTDSHYEKKEDIGLHSAFLNAKADEGNEREVDEFYKTAYIMSEEEVRSYFSHWDKDDINTAIENTEKISNRVQDIDLFHKQVVPKRPIPKEWVPNPMFFPNTEYIKKYLNSTHEQDRALMYLVEKNIKEKIDKEDYEDTFNRLEEELTEIWIISESLEDRLSAYFVTMNKNIEICWNDAHSIIGVGRGSGVSSIINYLLDITQINPLKMPYELPFWRFLNRSRAELPDC